jgi:hypothetical protein
LSLFIIERKMNFQNKGIPIAILKSKHKKSDPTILYLDTKNWNGREAVQDIDLSQMRGGSGLTFQVLPTECNDRDTLYVCGEANSGKSFFIKDFVIQYHKMHPKNPIYVISPKSDDKSFSEIKKWIIQLKLGDEFVNTDFALEDFTNSFVIFDDIEGIMDKRLKEKVFALLNLMITVGRSNHITVAVVSHRPNSGKDTSLFLLENSMTTFFPHHLPDHHLNYLCKNYIGLSKHHINKILSLNTRACSVVNTFPKVVICEKNAFLVTHKPTDK